MDDDTLHCNRDRPEWPIVYQLARIADALEQIVTLLPKPSPIIGIVALHSVPVTRDSSSIKESSMTTVKLVKKSAFKAAASGAKATGAAFGIQDNQDDTLTVFGTDAAGAQVDISAVATLSAMSDTPAVCSVDAPAGMTVAFHGVSPGSANLTVTATWSDGSIGPFTFIQPVTCTGGPATGITVVLGTPTVRP